MNDTSTIDSGHCYCGGDSYQHCCRPLHQGNQLAQTPEQLMRARYSACCRKDVDFLLATTHLSSRQFYRADELRQWLGSQQWLSLQIVSTFMQTATEGYVDFIAFYRLDHDHSLRQHREYSQFIQEKEDDGAYWYFVGGEDRPDLVIERNRACPCGSGKKHKKCCL